jgi:hypothetical protein
VGTVGTELLQQLMSGELAKPTPETVERVRSAVTPALVELLDRGFRARPMLLQGKLVGFVRGLHAGERRQLFTWFTDAQDRIFHLLSLATTLTTAEIEALDGYEAQAILNLVDKATDADLSLYPYLSAFSTTSPSEILWYARGASVGAWTDRKVSLPGGWSFNMIAPPDHARLWSGVAAMRERSKRRVDDTYNAAMITRALTGKGADKLYQALKKTQESLQPDLDAPWMQVVRVEVRDINFADGWGHAHQDDSVEGILREVEGMAKMDKHERFMAAFYNQQMEAAQQQEAEMEARFQRAMESSGIEDSASVLTHLQIKDLDKRDRDRQDRQQGLVTKAISSAHDAEERREARANQLR